MKYSAERLKKYFVATLKNIKRSIVSKALLALTVFIFLFVSNDLCAQTKDSLGLVSKPTITLKDGATLFSTDKSFNNQVSSNKIIRDKADIAYQNNKNGVKSLEMKTPKKGSGTISKDTPKNDTTIKKAQDSILKNKKKVSYVYQKEIYHC